MCHACQLDVVWIGMCNFTSNSFFFTRRWHIGVYGRFLMIRIFFNTPRSGWTLGRNVRNGASGWFPDWACTWIFWKDTGFLLLFWGGSWKWNEIKPNMPLTCFEKPMVRLPHSARFWGLDLQLLRKNGLVLIAVKNLDFPASHVSFQGFRIG